MPFIIGRGICFKFVSSWGKIPMNSLALKKSVRLFYICYQTFRFQIKILLDSTKLFPLFHSISQILSLSFILTQWISNATKIFFFSGMVSFDSPESNSKIHRTMLKIPIVNRENPIQPNWVSVPRRWESGRVLDTRKENDYNSEFGQVMLATSEMYYSHSYIKPIPCWTATRVTYFTLKKNSFFYFRIY